MYAGFQFLVDLEGQPGLPLLVAHRQRPNAARRGCYHLVKFSHVPSLNNKKLSPAPQTQHSAAFLFFPRWLLADISSPLKEIFSHLRIRYLAKRIAPANRLQNVNVLIRYLPEKFLTNNLFDLCFRDNAPALLPIENNPQPI